jgi:hypothetical protein
VRAIDINKLVEVERDRDRYMAFLTVLLPTKEHSGSYLVTYV